MCHAERQQVYDWLAEQGATAGHPGAAAGEGRPCLRAGLTRHRRASQDDRLLELAPSAAGSPLATVTLGSGIAMLDGTVVNIALRQIGTDLDASLAELQWVSNGYLLSLASLILVGGALGDRLGRRRIYLLGVVGFALGSALCAFAQSPVQLVRVPGAAGRRRSPARARCAGAHPGVLPARRTARQRSAPGPGVSGIAVAIGPFLGGFLVEHAGWRWIFAINLPLCALVILMGMRMPESRDEEAPRHFDYTGALAGVVALGVTTYLLTSWRDPRCRRARGRHRRRARGLGAFVVLEQRPTRWPRSRCSGRGCSRPRT